MECVVLEIVGICLLVSVRLNDFFFVRGAPYCAVEDNTADAEPEAEPEPAPTDTADATDPPAPVEQEQEEDETATTTTSSDNAQPLPAVNTQTVD